MGGFSSSPLLWLFKWLSCPMARLRIQYTVSHRGWPSVPLKYSRQFYPVGALLVAVGLLMMGQEKKKNGSRVCLWWLPAGWLWFPDRAHRVSTVCPPCVHRQSDRGDASMFLKASLDVRRQKTMNHHVWKDVLYMKRRQSAVKIWSI